MTTLAHISDLHFGAERTDVVEGLLRDLVQTAPALVVVSGDLTQRARRAEFEAASAFLARIPFAKLVVPGNHDVPLFDVVQRFLRPLARFRAFIGPDVDPFFANDAIAVLGLNTARSNTWKDGRLSALQIETIRRRLAPVPAGVSKVLVTHHPFLPPPGDPSPPVVGRADEAIAAAEECGVDLVLSGHLHCGYTGEIRREPVDGRRTILVAQAGTATSHRLRNEANSYNVIELTPERIDFALRVWDGGHFQPARTSAYVKDKRQDQWRPVSS